MSDSQHAVWLENPEGKKFPIIGTCSIGRSATNQIALTGDRVSRRHALVHAQELHQYWLVDLGSSNGTRLNDRRVNQPIMLHHGDRIEIDATTLTFKQRAADVTHEGLAPSDRTLVEIKTATCWLLVADMISSTQLDQRFAPEELPLLTGQWLADCKQLIEECGGSINKFLGDGFLAYWHHRDGMVIQVVRALKGLKQLQCGSKLPFRFVVHRDAVFLGGASLGEENLSGREVNFVFRMEKVAAQLAEPCLLSERAASLLMAHLACEDAGQHRVPDFDGNFAFRKFSTA